MENDVLDEEQRQNIREVFDRFSSNGDGNITFEVLPKAMNILGIKPTQEEINNLINEYDLDGDGHIDFAEFQQIYMSRRPPPNEKQVLEAFRQFDRNGTGLIDVSKIQAVAGKFNFFLTNEEVKKIIDELDEDRDGYINWLQFRNAILD